MLKGFNPLGLQGHSLYNSLMEASALALPCHAHSVFLASYKQILILLWFQIRCEMVSNVCHIYLLQHTWGINYYFGALQGYTKALFPSKHTWHHRKGEL